MKTCGSCYAGIVLMAGYRDCDIVERCDECALFETDADAADAVRALLKLLHTEYLAGADTVADALDRLSKRSPAAQWERYKARRK